VDQEKVVEVVCCKYREIPTGSWLGYFYHWVLERLEDCRRVTLIDSRLGCSGLVAVADRFAWLDSWVGSQAVGEALMVCRRGRYVEQHPASIDRDE